MSLIPFEMKREGLAPIFFTVPWSKVQLSLPAQKCKCGIFGPGMMKNRIRTTGVKLASPHCLPPSCSARGWQLTRAMDSSSFLVYH